VTPVDGPGVVYAAEVLVVELELEEQPPELPLTPD